MHRRAAILYTLLAINLSVFATSQDRPLRPVHTFSIVAFDPATGEMGVAVQSTKAGPRSGEEIFERYYKRQVPQRRMMEPEEIAQVAVFLALPESAGITGQALNVDGGFVMS